MKHPLSKNINKLHLGCGEKYIPDFIHIDIKSLPHIDYVASGDRLTMFSDNSVDLIYACHILEHFKRKKVPLVLKEWYRVLKPSGKLRVAVPDFEAILKVYKQYGVIMNTLNGGQRDKNDIHYITFDFKKLKRYLEKAGFRKIKRYNWRKTEHKDIDDFSQAYYPHLDKKKGILISLNVEAIK